MIELKEITKDYTVGDQVIRAVRGVSLRFRKTEFVSILGPSGCGKTTLMNIIGGLDKYSDGDIVVDTKSTKNFADKDWDNYRNKKVGFVFQSYNLISHLTVLANVEMAMTISGVTPKERERRAKQALEEVGLSDYLKNRPNQLSGGQMQRVAIARALVNQPEILIADEPTGALDTTTSGQILKLLKEVAKDKLVIMVTHNPDLANEYSTRLVGMKDGVITEDSNPYLEEDAARDTAEILAGDALLKAQLDIEKTAAEEAYKYAKNSKDKAKAKTAKIALFKIKKRDKLTAKKTSMSYATALSLSGKNLKTKKGRSIMTAIASAIGIIGIALIMSISNGMNAYIAKVTTDNLASSPISISSLRFDLTQGGANTVDYAKTKYPEIAKIYAEQKRNASKKPNKLTQEYYEYITNNLNSEWYSDIIAKTGLTLNVYQTVAIGKEFAPAEKTSNWQMLLKTDFLKGQYDVLAGELPKDKSEVVLIVDEYNKVPIDTLHNLGIKDAALADYEFDFNTVLGKEYKIITNNLLYTLSGDKFVKNTVVDTTSALSVKITGIIRTNKSTEMGVMKTGLGYTKELYDYIQTENYKSEIATFMLNNYKTTPENLKNPIDGTIYSDTSYNGVVTSTKFENWTADLRKLGGVTSPNEINIYAATEKGKENIMTALNKYNEGKDDSTQIQPIDSASIIASMMKNMINIITYVLIAFTAISLVVSAVMISIITYVSVLERTREIGILRAIGARKKDITRVFNAETIILGFMAGIIGIVASLLLSIPINLIVKSLAGVAQISQLSVLNAVILIAISTLITLLAGLLPAMKAAKRDPVTCLRSE